MKLQNGPISIETNDEKYSSFIQIKEETSEEVNDGAAKKEGTILIIKNLYLL